MTRKGLLEALLGVAYEDDDDGAPPRAVDPLIAPVDTAGRDVVHLRAVPAISSSVDAPERINGAMPTHSELVATIELPDGYRASSIPLGRVGIWGGLLGLLEQDDLDAGLEFDLKVDLKVDRDDDLDDDDVFVPAPAMSHDIDALAAFADVVADVVNSGSSVAETATQLHGTDEIDDDHVPDAITEPGQTALEHILVAPSPVMPAVVVPAGIAPGAPEQAPQRRVPADEARMAPSQTPAVEYLEPSSAPSPTGERATRPDGVPPVAEPVPGTATDVDDDELHRDIASFDVGRRRRALRSLLMVPMTEDVVHVVAGSLLDPEANIRHLAIQVLERAPELVSSQVLESVIVDIDPSIRARAARLAGRSTDPAVVEVLVAQLLEENDLDVASAVLNALADLARSTGLESEHLDQVCHAIGVISRDEYARIQSHVQQFAQAVESGEIAHRLASDDAVTRAGAAVLCFESRDEYAESAVARLVGDDHPLVRRVAATSIARRNGSGVEHRGPVLEFNLRSTSTGDDRVVDALLPGLIDVLNDPNPEIREQAARALERMPSRRVADWIWSQSRSADSFELTRLIRVAALLDLDHIAEQFAHALVGITDGPMPKRLRDAASEFQPIADVASSWRTSADAQQRVTGVQLSALLEYPDTSALLGGLSDLNTDVRVAAATLAAQLEVDSEISELLMMLVNTDASPRVRVAAIGALRNASVGRRVEAAQQVADAIDPDVRLAALSLVAIDDDSAFAVLADALHDDSPEVVRRAGTLMLEQRAPDALALLWELIRIDHQHRDILIDVLRLGAETSLRRLANQALNSFAATERLAGISGLVALPGGEREPLINALADTDVRVRRAALHTLACRRDVELVDIATRALEDPEPSVRAMAIWALVLTDDASSVHRVVEMLDDVSSDVRSAAIEAMSDSRSPSLIDLLFEELSRPEHRAVAADLLAARSDAVDRLFYMLASISHDEDRREVIVDALRRAGRVKRLVEDLEHHDQTVRKAALQRLGLVASEHEADAVAQRLTDPHPGVRIDAARLLGSIGGRAAIDALRDAFASDLNMEVVAAIEHSYRGLMNDV